MNDNILLKIFLLFFFGFIIYHMLQYNIEPYSWDEFTKDVSPPKFISKAIENTEKAIDDVEKDVEKKASEVADEVEDSAAFKEASKMAHKVEDEVEKSAVFKEATEIAEDIQNSEIYKKLIWLRKIK